MKILGVVSLKGGVGKTTSSINIAGVLQSRGHRVVLADQDRLKSATSLSRLGNLPFPVTSLGGVSRLANESPLDYLVIDSRGGLDDDELYEMVDTCDLLVLPSNPEVMSLDGMQQTIELLEKRGSASRATVLLTMTRPGKRLQMARRTLDSLEIPVMASSVRFSDAFKDASAQGVVVRDVKTNTLAKTCWLDYGQVTDELLAIMGALK